MFNTPVIILLILSTQILLGRINTLIIYSSVYAQNIKQVGLTLGKLPLTESGIDLVNLCQGNEDIGMSKQVIHFLECSSSSLVEEEVENEGIGETTDGEDEVVLPAC